MADRSSEIVSLIRAISDKVEGVGSTDIKDLPDSTDLRGTWSGKQDAIQDLETIRSGAALGATALQSFTETDPTVPAWAKASVKPSYSASEITNAVSSTIVSTIWKGTQTEYDNLQTKDPNTFYIIVDAGPELISFYIDDVEYQAESGMTFGEWVNTDYNVPHNTLKWTFEYNVGWMTDNISKIMLRRNVDVEENDVIEADYVYDSWMN